VFGLWVNVNGQHCYLGKKNNWSQPKIGSKMWLQEDDEPDCLIQLRAYKFNYKFDIPSAHYRSISDLIEEINVSFNDFLIKNNFVRNQFNSLLYYQHRTNKVRSYFTSFESFIEVTTTERVKVKVKKDQNTSIQEPPEEEEADQVIKKEEEEIIEVEDELVEVDQQMEIVHTIVGIKLPTSISNILGFREYSRLSIFDKTTNLFSPDLYPCTSALFVYCNAIEYSVVGNTLAPLLKILSYPIHKSQPNEMIAFEIDNKEYKRLNSKVVTTLQVSIRDDCGRLLSIFNRRVIATLHFKFINNSTMI
jgi:hypothetical protein